MHCHDGFGAFFHERIEYTESVVCSGEKAPVYEEYDSQTMLFQNAVCNVPGCHCGWIQENKEAGMKPGPYSPHW